MILIPKLHSEMKQKLGILFSCYMTVCQLIRHLWWMGVVESRYLDLLDAF